MHNNHSNVYNNHSNVYNIFAEYYSVATLISIRINIWISNLVLTCGKVLKAFSNTETLPHPLPHHYYNNINNMNTIFTISKRYSQS